MVKHYIRRDTTTATLNAGGNYGVIDSTVDLVAYIDVLCEEQEIVGVHDANLVVRVTSSGGISETHVATLIEYLNDNAIANYLPAAASDQEQVEDLIDGFTSAGNTSFKIIGRPKISAPVKAFNSNSQEYLFETTFVVNVKKIVAEAAKLVDDPLTTQAFKAGFALLVQGENSEAFYITSELHVEYTVHNRPLRVFLRKNI